jgi:hypothetical protein
MLIHEYSPANNNNNNNNNNNKSSSSPPAPGDDIVMERGGVLRTYPSDVHMDSLASVWNPSKTQLTEDLDPKESSFQEENFSPVHLIVLQHGFQGTGFDMRLIRNALHMEFPQYLVPPSPSPSLSSASH